MSTLMMLLPPEYAAFLFIAAGLAFICQAKRLGARLLMGGVTVILLPPLIAPLLSLVPLSILVLLLVGFGLSMAGGLLRLLAGRAVADHALGALLADAIRFFLVLPFRLVGGVLTLLFRRGAP